MMAGKKHGNDDFYNQETRLALLEQSIDYIGESLRDIKDEFKSLNSKIDSQVSSLTSRIDSQVSSLTVKIDSEVASLSAKIDSQGLSLNSKIETLNSRFDSHFKWTIALIFGLYATTIGTLFTLVGKFFHFL